MPRPKTFPHFRHHTIYEFEALREERVKTEEVNEDSIYEAMTRLVSPEASMPEVLSMPVRIEEIQHKRARNELAQISLKIILLDKDFQPSIPRTSMMTDGMWSFNRPLDLIGAKPMKIGFLLPSLPDEVFSDSFTLASNDIREDMYV